MSSNNIYIIKFSVNLQAPLPPGSASFLWELADRKKQTQTLSPVAQHQCLTSQMELLEQLHVEIYKLRMGSRIPGWHYCGLTGGGSIMMLALLMGNGKMMRRMKIFKKSQNQNKLLSSGEF